MATTDDRHTARDEKSWVAGRRAALTSMLGRVLGDLGYQDAEASRAAWVLEREGVVRVLRRVCGDFGDNNWPVDLDLGDVIEKHLEVHLHDGAVRP